MIHSELGPQANGFAHRTSETAIENQKGLVSIAKVNRNQKDSLTTRIFHQESQSYRHEQVAEREEEVFLLVTSLQQDSI